MNLRNLRRKHHLPEPNWTIPPATGAAPRIHSVEETLAQEPTRVRMQSRDGTYGWFLIHTGHATYQGPAEPCTHDEQCVCCTNCGEVLR